MRRLGERHIVAVDARGHGRTGYGDGAPFDYWDLARDALAKTLEHERHFWTRRVEALAQEEATDRLVATDTELCGVPMKQGEVALLLLAVAPKTATD